MSAKLGGVLFAIGAAVFSLLMQFNIANDPVDIYEYYDNPALKYEGVEKAHAVPNDGNFSNSFK